MHKEAIHRTRLRNLVTYAFKSKQQLLDYVAGQHKILVAINAEKILNANRELEAIINANIGYADGIGAVLALRRKSHKAVKIPGVELWLDIIQNYYKDKSFYLIGSTDHVIEATVNKLKNQHPGIKILNYRNGFLKIDEVQSLKEDLQSQKPDIVFVAMGSPKQEFLMDELMKAYPALYMGLGGSFDVFCGVKKRAPKIFLNTGTEWLYRLMKEPVRIKRQWVLFKFLVLLLCTDHTFYMFQISDVRKHFLEDKFL